MIALTEFMEEAVSDRIGDSDAGFAGSGTTLALMPMKWRWTRRLASRPGAFSLARLTEPDAARAAEPDGTHGGIRIASPQDAPQDGSGPDPVLATFRRSIDNIDAALIHILAERFRITQAVGEYKAKAAMPPADPARERRQIDRLRQLASEADLDPEFSEKFIRFVIDEVIRHHQRARGD